MLCFSYCIPKRMITFTYLLCCSVDILYVHKNCNCPYWLPLQDLSHHIYIFREVFDITCITLTWVIVSFCYKWFKTNDLLWRGNLHLTGVALTICHLEPVTNMVLCKDNGKELKIVWFSCTEGVDKLLCFGVSLSSLLLVLLASNMDD